MKTSEMTEKNKKKKVIALGLAGALLVGGAAGSTYAYFTDHHTVMNEFTVGKVRTDLKETQWDSSGKASAGELRPDMTIIKDPVITNTGTSDSYNFISFRIPYGKFAALGTFGKSVINGKETVGQCTDFALDAKGQVDVSEKDLFRHEVNTGWVLVETKTGSDFHEYTYAYATGTDADTGSMKALSKSESTTALFKDNKIRAVNFVEDEWALQNSCIATEGKKFNIPVRTYSIQTTDIGGTDGAGKNDPATVWAAVKTQVDAKYAGMAEEKWGNTFNQNDGNGNEGTYGLHDHATRTAADAKTV